MSLVRNIRHSAVTNMTGAGIPDSVATTITGHLARHLQALRHPAGVRAAGRHGEG
jgi:hypothetical protein